MNLLHDDSSDLEDELRAMLRRRAVGVGTDQPDWGDLVDRPEAVVFSLTSADRAASAESGGRGTAGGWGVRYRPRPVFVAAAVVAVVLAGGLAVGQTRDSGTTGVEESPASFTAAAPTDASFDASAAPTVWASELEDPVAATQAYLAAVGVGPALGADGLPVPDAGALPEVTLLETAGDVAIAEWTAVEAGVAHSGTVYLRADAVEQAGGTAGEAAGQAGEAVDGARSTATSTWGVVGAAVDGIALTDIAYDGQQLSFSITSTADAAEPVAVSVWSDGQQVAADGGDVVQAGAMADDGLGAGATGAGDQAAASARADEESAAAGAAAGQAVDPSLVHVIDLGDAGEVPLTADMPDASSAVVRVQQLADGQVTSVSEVAVDLPGTGTAAGTDVAGSGNGAGAGADAGAGAETQLPDELGDTAGEVRDTAEGLVEGGEPAPLPGDDPESAPPSVPTTLLPPDTPTTLPTLPAPGDGLP